jgi:hypothetical protein
MPTSYFLSAQKVADAQRKASQEREEAQLDTLWEQMELAGQERIDAEARKRLGVLGRMGNAQGALKAMRRNLMREHSLKSACSTERLWKRWTS